MTEEQYIHEQLNPDEQTHLHFGNRNHPGWDVVRLGLGMGGNVLTEGKQKRDTPVPAPSNSRWLKGEDWNYEQSLRTEQEVAAEQDEYLRTKGII